MATTERRRKFRLGGAPPCETRLNEMTHELEAVRAEMTGVRATMMGKMRADIGADKRQRCDDDDADETGAQRRSRRITMRALLATLTTIDARQAALERQQAALRTNLLEQLNRCVLRLERTAVVTRDARAYVEYGEAPPAVHIFGDANELRSAPSARRRAADDEKKKC